MGLADGWCIQERELVRRGPASAKGGCERSERDRVKVRNVWVRARPDRREVGAIGFGRRGVTARELSERPEGTRRRPVRGTDAVSGKHGGIGGSAWDWRMAGTRRNVNWSGEVRRVRRVAASAASATVDTSQRRGV